MTIFFQTKYIAVYSLFLILKYVNMLADRDTDLIRHLNKPNACISGWSLNITGINQQKCESKNCIFAEAHWVYYQISAILCLTGFMVFLVRKNLLKS